MKQYNIQVTQNSKVVAGILLPVLLVIPLAVLLIFLTRHNATDEVIVPVIIVFIIVFFGVTWFMVRQSMFGGLLTLKPGSFTIAFTTHRIFAPSDFELKLEDITNFWVDSHQGLRYMSFNTAIKPAAFNVAPASNSEADVAEFEELLAEVSAQIETYNNSDTPAQRVIDSRTMYETLWAKLLAVFLIGVMLGSPVIYFFTSGISEAPVGKFLVLLIFGLPFLYKVYYHNFRK